MRVVNLVAMTLTLTTVQTFTRNEEFYWFNRSAGLTNPFDPPCSTFIFLAQLQAFSSAIPITQL